ncbi:MAG: sensor histidine kinase N-terminal domain-containing protein [Gammaproteobacteria bacterium]|nr:sensor histidine kinase N-terminal domain-containing protein [Gammaproteobacteria bacterium]
MPTNRQRQPSIEQRLRRLTIAGVGTVLLIAGGALDYFVVDWISSEFDRTLLAKTRALITLTKQHGDEVELDFADEFMPEFETSSNPEYFQLWLKDGSVLERSRSLKSNDLAHTGDRPLGERFSDLTLPDGRAGRAIEVVFLAQIDDKEAREVTGMPWQQRMTLVVARERESLDRSLLMKQLSLLAAVIVIIAGVAWVVKHAVKKGLRPLHDVGEQLRQFDATLLSSRLAVDTPRELRPVIEQFNDLLERLEFSFQREQRFTADVAHELRTPVAELHNLAEVAVRWPDDRELLANFFQDVLGASRQMQRTINNLLALTRCEKRNFLTLDYQALELSDLLDGAWLRVRKEAQTKQLRYRRLGPTACRCQVSVTEIELILNNLFSNAVAYSRPDSEITASITVQSDDVTLTLSNTAEHLLRADLAKMFDRLWRKDPARTGEHHAGLGLTLVKAYAQILQLNVTTGLSDHGVFSISINGLRQVASDPLTTPGNKPGVA